MNDKKWKIKTQDGNIYGPADTETVKKWIQDNRISKEDYLSVADSEEWKKPDEINEFASLFTGKKEDFSLPQAQQRTLTTQVVSDGWGVLKASLFPIIGTSLLYLVVIIGVNFIPFIGKFATYLIAGPLVVGWSWYCLCKIRKQEVSTAALFDGFKLFLPALGAYLLITILTILGYIALIVPGIILISAYSLAYFFMIDKKMGPWQAMKASFDITKGYRWRVLAVLVLCGLINILGVLCLVIGVLVTIPLTTLALASLYQRLTTGNIHESQKQTPKSEILLGVVVPALTALVIMGILAAIMIPALKVARESAKRASCISNLKEIGFALNRYAQDYDGQFPATIMQLYPKYVDYPSLLRCESDKDPWATDITNNEIDKINSARISYQYDSGHNTSESSDLPLVWDNGCGGSLDNHREGGSVLYLDGHVQWVPKEKWKNPTHGEDSYPNKNSR